MPLPLTRTPRPHRARRTRRHAGAAPAAAAGRRALRRPPLLSPGGGPRPAALALGALAALLSLAVAARAGALTRLWDFLDYGAGVLSLVSLTSAVLWGLAATDRKVLTSGHRLVAQGAHRGLAVSGLGFLALHIWVKVAESHTGAASIFLPLADRDKPVLIGLGTLAGYLFVAVAVSGAVRSAFATKGRSMWWRALHMGAYPAWGASLVHGLKAGRAASPWVTVMYGLCLAGVAAVLAIRLRARLRAMPARPGAAQQPAAPQAPGGQAPPRTPRPFVRQPAEQSGERLTTRLAEQLEWRPADEPERQDPPPFRPAYDPSYEPAVQVQAVNQPYEQPFEQPFEQTFDQTVPQPVLPTFRSAEQPAARAAFTAEAVGRYSSPVFIPSMRGPAPDGLPGEQLDGLRGRQ
ncbi:MULTISPECIES: hypothetical protein [unclassified Streptomyces]|uniref:hypothetical protein n=1 Tax=unclassified Streptomyces TaxID=2593676 RepID=UPI00225271F4|nr:MULTISPECIES: hypothetical protein [unclassified Streptomyces]MCX4529383.1 hypothetical protein [Streptomyces sp. NBC_01551]MCX4540077.1 hypothetical protein [Streptomyces sp. NBC_01565]